MKAVAHDYEASSSEGEFDVVPDGKHQVEEVGLMSKSLDEKTSKPVLIQGSFGMQLYIYLQTIGEEPLQIPCSTALKDLPYLVKAFGGKVELLPPVPNVSQAERVEAYILKALELANNGTRNPTATVREGWANVNYLDQAGLSADSYHFRFSRFVPEKEGIPQLKQDNYGGLYTHLILEVVADSYGEEFCFSGVDFFNGFFNYKVEAKNGEPDWLRGKDGKYTPTAKNFALFVQVIAPTLFEGEAVFADPNNILPEIQASALDSGVIFKGQITLSKKGRPFLDLGSVKAADPSRLNLTTKDEIPPVQMEAKLPEPTANTVISGWALKILNTLAGDDDLFDTYPSSPAGLTAEQKGMLRTYLSPIASQFTTKNLAEWVEEDLDIFIASVLEVPELDEAILARVHELRAEYIDENEIPF